MQENSVSRIIHADALAALREMAEESVDMVFTDFPYGIADGAKMTMQGAKAVSTKDAWGNDFKDCWKSVDAYISHFMPAFEEIFRVLKFGGSFISFFDRKITGHIAVTLEKTGFIYRNKMYFEKKNPIPNFRKNNYRSSMEEAIWLTKPGAPYTFNFGAQEDMKQIIFSGNIGGSTDGNGAVGRHHHPCEKYLWMLLPIIQNHSNPGDLVVDPFAGSCSTCVAAAMMGRKYIGIERDEHYAEVGRSRVRAEESQIKFSFDTEETIDYNSKK